MYYFRKSHGTHRYAATRGSQELDWNAPALELDPNMFYSSLRKTISDQDCNGWSDPGGKGFMVRSRTYNVDSLKVCSTPFILSSSQTLLFYFIFDDDEDATRCSN